MNAARVSLTIAALISIITSGAVTLGDVLESHLNPNNGHIYHLLNVASWTASEAEATTLGGHLASIGSQSEQDWIWQTFGVGKGRHLWAGLTDVALEGTFVWSNGEPLTYTNWTPGEPNNMGRAEHWVHLDGYRNGKWNDMDERNPGSVVLPVYGLVELVPEPASLSLGIGGAATLLIALMRACRQG